MWRNGSDPRSGFTLLEGLVAMAVSGILIASVARFFRDSTGAFNRQKQLADRDQNAHYVITRLSDILMQAGHNLPEQRWDVIDPESSPAYRLAVTVNPRGGKQTIAAALNNESKIPVAEEKEFRGASSVLWVPFDDSKPVKLLAIDKGFNSGGFKEGLKKVSHGIDTLRLVDAVSLLPGDVLYAADREDYHLDGTRLMQGKMLMAEHIDTLAITYFDKDRKPVTEWASMRSARITVSARTPFPEKNAGGDGYRRISLSMDVRLRNRR